MESYELVFDYQCLYLSNNKKESMIINKTSRLARIIVQDEHINTFHRVPQLVLTRILRKFMIMYGKRLIKSMLCKVLR